MTIYLLTRPSTLLFAQKKEGGKGGVGREGWCVGAFIGVFFSVLLFPSNPDLEVWSEFSMTIDESLSC